MPSSLGEANLLTLGTLERCGEDANFIISGPGRIDKVHGWIGRR